MIRNRDWYYRLRSSAAEIRVPQCRVRESHLYVLQVEETLLQLYVQFCCIVHLVGIHSGVGYHAVHILAVPRPSSIELSLIRSNTSLSWTVWTTVTSAPSDSMRPRLKADVAASCMSERWGRACYHNNVTPYTHLANRVGEGQTVVTA
jgi:hypothetical protein